jgi:Uncharacterized protein conserved in bacteria
MKIWVDADACPAVVKDILYRAAQRSQRMLTLVANQMLHTPPSPWIKAVQVPRGFDVADSYIVEQVTAGDLVITSDIPLASEVIGKGARVLSPRGERYTADNISERLTMRDMMDELRSTGINVGGPAPFSQSDRHAFARALDQLLHQVK